MENLVLNNIEENFYYKLNTRKNVIFDNKNKQIKLSKISRNFDDNNNKLTKFNSYKKLSKKINNNSSLSIFSKTNFSSNFSQENKSFNFKDNKILNKINSQNSIFNNNNNKKNELNKKSKNLFLNGIYKFQLKKYKNNNNKNFFPILNKKNYIKNSIPKEINFNDLNNFSINFLHKKYNLFLLEQKLKHSKIQSNLNRQILIEFNKHFTLIDPKKFSEKFRLKNDFYN